jgi:Rps23 Pro-64 3,4-dihydroxylase Tpa1-like proline 4-hydroxylase
MKIVHQNKKFAIIDDVLPDEQFDRLWKHFQAEQFSIPHAQQWQKVWRLTDANCLGGPSYQLTKKPFNNYMDGVSSYLLAALKYAPEIKGDQGKDWSEATFRPYIYPRGSKLSWHNDGGSYHAALTYYCHPYWGSTWGGELMVAEVPDLQAFRNKHKGQPHLDHRWEDEFLAERGLGQWIFPKPNRLVIMAAGVFHTINRVDPDAGDHARCSIVSFLVKDKKESDQCPTECHTCN